MVRLNPTVEFEVTWESLGGPVLEKEYRFHPDRRWRSDYAHPDSRVLIEIEGGTWVRGRHVRPKGFIADCEKYATAALMGWTVFRLPSEMIDDVWIGQIIDYCRRNG